MLGAWRSTPVKKNSMETCADQVGQISYRTLLEGVFIMKWEPIRFVSSISVYFIKYLVCFQFSKFSKIHFLLSRGREENCLILLWFPRPIMTIRRLWGLWNPNGRKLRILRMCLVTSILKWHLSRFWTTSALDIFVKVLNFSFYSLTFFPDLLLKWHICVCKMCVMC